MLKEEEKFGIKDFKTYQQFGEKVYKIRENVMTNLKRLKNKRKTVIGYALRKSNNGVKFLVFQKR